MLNAPSFALLPIYYGEKLESIISLAEIMAGVGYMGGPVIGGVLADLGGYYLPFLFSGIANLMVLILCLKWIPANIGHETPLADILNSNNTNIDEPL